MQDTRSFQAIPHAADAGAGGWLPGLPHAALGLAVAPVLGISPCIAGLLLAAMVSFVVYLPLTALALNGGRPIGEDDPAPPMTRMAHIVLLVLWTATTWGTAYLVTIR